MMVVGHQPNFLPYLGFLHKAAEADMFVIVDHVQFVKRGPFGWIHRNRIRTKDGWGWLTVPVLTKGKFEQSIADVAINNALPWRRKHWRTIELAYGKAPHFEAHAERLRAIYDRPWERLLELNEAILAWLFETFGIDCPVRRSSELGAAGKGTDLVIDITRKAKGDVYLSGIHGRDYLDTDRVAAAGIDLRFQEFAHPIYRQTGPGDFIPNLAAIDLLFNRGRESRSVLLGEAA